MAYVFNPFTSTFDVTSGASDHWLDPVSTAASLPASGNSTGDTRAATDTGAVYVWSGSAWINSSGISGIGSAVVGGTNKSVLFVDSSGNLAQDNSAFNYDQSTDTLTSGQIIDSGLTANTVPYANGSKQLTSSAVTPTELGYVSGVTSAIQTQFSGKVSGPASAIDNAITRFDGTTGKLVQNSGASIDDSGNLTATNLSGTNTGDVTLTAVGSSPSANGASLSGQALTLQPADGTRPGLLTSGSQTIGGAKTFSSTIAASNFSGTSSGTNTGDQTITLTGDVTGSGTGSFAATIANSAVTNAKMANMSNNTVKANKSGTAAPSDLALSDITETGSSILTISNGSKTVISASNVTVQVTQSDTTHSGYLSSTDWNTFNGKANKSSGDISETSFTAADNQSSAANVTSFAFANATVRAFDALVSVVRNTTYANYILRGIQKAASWELSQDFVGDTTGLTFSITSAGQIQYQSTSTGSTATVKFRAITVSV